jgi:hypothetical protein
MKPARFRSTVNYGKRLDFTLAAATRLALPAIPQSSRETEKPS